jgi:hypothetical protein
LQSNCRHHPTPLFWYLGFHGNAILNYINMPKASTHYGEYSYNVSWSLMKEIKIFYFHGNCGKVCLIDSDFFLPISFHEMWMWQETLLQNFVKFGVNLTFFAPWLPWQRPPFWICSTPQNLPHTTVSSISIRRVTYYDHFCVFQFFSILAVSMATAAILKLEAQWAEET